MPNDGVIGGVNCVIRDLRVFKNGGNGITASGCTVSGNTVHSNKGDGIKATSGSHVYRNTVSANFGYGLNLGNAVAYRDNFMSSAGVGNVTGGVNAGGNVCSFSLTCP